MIIDKDIPDDVPIADPDSLEEKKYFEVGELCIAGDHVFKEYYGEPEKTACAKFERDGKTIPICPMKGTLENKKILDFLSQII